ncbi:MAG: M14 family metallopeptidase, partial [Oscillospiraceae bacterium]|nr:M14 family metallopeptidase [Oscillospiraceae bacterium]
MKKDTVFELKSIYRDNMRVSGMKFGNGEKSVCIVGGMRGNELQQIYCCSQLVSRLKEIEKSGNIIDGKSILIIPVANTYSINIQKRFWPTDNTDINRMFPGYNLGETTQRIAAGVFEAVKDYKYGIQFASNYIPGNFIPHVRMMKTGYENVELANKFGLPYVVLRNPRPYDTTTLNYNWQLWNTSAFSVFTNETANIDKESANQSVTAILNFLNNVGIIHFENHRGYIPSLVEESRMIGVKSDTAGIFDRIANVNATVKKGDVLANIIDPIEGSVK